ncbi:MAG: biotin/lipoyl-binding protein [Ktedonobacteraceae bacterium]|nr:biotin/lipoyl-binding protein [Ktedonobacteraceae bacterium]
METPEKPGWLERIEHLIQMLEGSTISELELAEGDTEIVIRRTPGMMMTAMPAQADDPPGASNAPRADHSVPVVAPLTGVYYAAASPASPPFVQVGDVIHVGQVVALVEAMKVFNEITAEVTGRVVAIVAKNGDVVQKGDVLLRVEPL